MNILKIPIGENLLLRKESRAFLNKNAQAKQINKTISKKKKKNLNGTFPTNNPGIVKMKWECRFSFRL